MDILLVAIPIGCQTKPFIELRPNRLADDPFLCINQKIECLRYDPKNLEKPLEIDPSRLSKCLNQPAPYPRPKWMR